MFCYFAGMHLAVLTAIRLARRLSYPAGRILLRATISSCVSANRDSDCLAIWKLWNR